MARKDRTSMDYQAQILELYKRGYSIRKIGIVLKICRKTVRKYVHRFEKQDEIIKQQTKEVFENKFEIPESTFAKEEEIILQFPEWLKKLDWRKILEDKRKGISYSILYKESDVAEVKYWSFWNTLKQLDKALNPSKPETTIKLNHIPGEKVFVDYTDGIDIVNELTGEITKTQLFVGTCPFSSILFAEFSFDQKLPSFIASHERMWKFFGGVSQYVVCDNLKSAVNKAHLYDPDVNKIFVSYANHAGFAVLPARPRRPKDKANVECHVGLVQKIFYQSVREKKFHTIGELNAYLFPFLKEFNSKIMKDYGVSREQRFEYERKFLQPLPEYDFIIPRSKDATVHPDCHIQFEKCYYSVPHLFVGKVVRVITQGNILEVFNKDNLEKIAVHYMSKKPWTRVTNETHLPQEKLQQTSFCIEKAIFESKKIGPKTNSMFQYIFSLPKPLIYLRRTQGWLRKISQGKCSRESMEYASEMAINHNNFSSNFITNCCEYFDKGGLRLLLNKQEIPQREMKYTHLK